MADPENESESRCCPLCDGIRAGRSVSDGREAKDMVLREEMNSRGRGVFACEKYLQIPTYLRWGRRLSAK